MMLCYMNTKQKENNNIIEVKGIDGSIKKKEIKYNKDFNADYKIITNKFC